MSRAAGWVRVIATTLVVIAIDQGTKAVVVSSIARGDATNVFFGLDLTNTRNRGVAFGFLEGQEVVVGLLIAGALVLLGVYFALNASRALLWLPVGMLLGGALGNLIDRIREGAVIDFIDPIAWPAFNVADASIVLGVLALLYVAETKPRHALPSHG